MGVFDSPAASSLESRVAQLETLVAALGAAVPANAGAGSTALSGEADLRTAGDAAGAAALTGERNARLAGDQANADQLAAEILARVAGDTVTFDQVELLASQLRLALGEAVVAKTWVDLLAIDVNLYPPGRAAKVYGPDAGTHVDPVAGGAPIANEGIFVAVPGPGGGWKRVANLEIADILAAIAAVNTTLQGYVNDPNVVALGGYLDQGGGPTLSDVVAVTVPLQALAPQAAALALLGPVADDIGALGPQADNIAIAAANIDAIAAAPDVVATLAEPGDLFAIQAAQMLALQAAVITAISPFA